MSIWNYNNERPKMTIDGITPVQNLSSTENALIKSAYLLSPLKMEVLLVDWFNNHRILDPIGAIPSKV